MIVLALDTCFNRCAALLFDSVGARVLAQEEAAMERGHAEALAPMVSRILIAAGLAPEAIQRLAVTTGPGTFTGLRIGLSFARAFGLANAVPVVGLDTLQAVGLSVPEGKRAIIIHRAGQSGFFYFWEMGVSHAIALLDADAVSTRISSAPALVMGTAADAFGRQENDESRLPPAPDLPSLSALAAYAAKQPAPETMPEPVYVRAADAKPSAASQFQITTAGPDDVAAMVRLHGACFAHGWNAADLLAMLAVPGTQALVARSEGQISSLLVLRAVAGEAEILTLATAPVKRQQGQAAALLAALSGLARAQGWQAIFLEVGFANSAARALYAKAGFAEAGLRKAYYAKAAGPAEDAILMKWAPPH